jgi:hypothetical protein
MNYLIIYEVMVHCGDLMYIICKILQSVILDIGIAFPTVDIYGADVETVMV